MKNFKHITLLCGHYGSGKTNVAINLAFDLKKVFENCAIADLDIVNPYFRTKDSIKELEAAGIRVIASQYAGTNLDAPALPGEIYALTEQKEMKSIIDVGGDDRGALALGRISKQIVDSADYEMLMVINKFRPLTPTAEDTLEVLHEIEYACRIPFTGIVNNSNLGVVTTAEDIISSEKYALEFSALSKLPIVMTTVRADLYNEVKDKVINAYPLTLQKFPV